MNLLPSLSMSSCSSGIGSLVLPDGVEKHPDSLLA